MIGFGKPLYKFTKRQINSLMVYDTKERAFYSKEQHVKLLLAASLVNGFAEGVSNSLIRAPTGETLLSYIKSQDKEDLQASFDAITDNNIRQIRKRRKLCRPVPIAIDWHDVMYYGDPETPMVIGTQHKKGSHYAYEYLTASVLVDEERIVLAVMPVSSRALVSQLSIAIIRRLTKQLGIRIRYVTLDGGFFTIEMLRFLEESGLRYILHMPSTSKTKRMRLWHGRRFRYRTNHNSVGHKKQAEFDVVVSYDKAKKYTYLLATNMKYGANALLKLFMKRWGIETSYRMSNQFLVKTTSRNYIVRLFYYLLACIVYNAWVIYNENEKCTVTRMKLCIIAIIVNGLIDKEDSIT